MKIYLDLVFIINAFFDFLLLLAVSIILKRDVSIKRLIMVSILSGLTIFIMFFNINSIELFIAKLLTSILMVILSFKYTNIKCFLNNLFYLYIVSIFLGGFLYILNSGLSYKNTGLIFYYNGLSINFILMFILGPLGIYIYIKQNKKRLTYNSYYNISLIVNDIKKDYIGYLDSGNLLVDPITKLPVIFINDNIEVNKYYLVPYKTIDKGGILKCFKASLIFNERCINVLVNLTNSINIDGVNCILNKEII